jgi:hypothetical protein
MCSVGREITYSLDQIPATLVTATQFRHPTSVLEVSGSGRAGGCAGASYAPWRIPYGLTRVPSGTGRNAIRQADFPPQSPAAPERHES